MLWVSKHALHGMRSLLAPPHGYLTHPLPHRSPARASAAEKLMYSQVISCLVEFLWVCSAWPANLPAVSWAQFPGALPKSWGVGSDSSRRGFTHGIEQQFRLGELWEQSGPGDLLFLLLMYKQKLLMRLRFPPCVSMSSLSSFLVNISVGKCISCFCCCNTYSLLEAACSCCLLEET